MLMPLIENELWKLWNKKSFFVIVLIMLALIPIITYAELMVMNKLLSFGVNHDGIQWLQFNYTLKCSVK
ncbi:hypothetical protein [Bacillus sp. FJAT-28004]|uniref:hypothetical protein n=1 Tax=Bacillus sp. FJAT-28004 TaxID=1679165 RepID=UPI00128EB78D|nr:hypothetical protein [Bacillus sp. FJAT-28004]